MTRRRLVAASLGGAGAVAILVAQIGVAVPASAGPAVTGPGSASAVAALLGVAPQASGASLTVTGGEARAAFQETEAQATAAAFDPGGLGAIASNDPICGQTLPRGAAPGPIQASSSSGPDTVTQNNGSGEEVVTAKGKPEYARAETRPVQQTLPGVLSAGGQATSEVRYLGGVVQQADASVTENLILLGGVVRLDGMTWNVHQVYGQGTSTATFSFGQVSIAGAPPQTFPANASPASVLPPINAVLAPFGLQLRAPQISVAPDGQSRSISPAQLHFSGSAQENALLSPFVGQITLIQDLIRGQTASGTDCSNFKNLAGSLANPAETVLDLGLGVAQGSGALDIDFGGAGAGAAPASQFVNPFANGPVTNPLLTPPAPAPAVAPGDPAPTAPADAPAAAPAAAAVSPAAAAPAGTTTAPAAAPVVGATTGTVSAPAATPRAPTKLTSSAVSFVCRTTSPAGGKGCWRGLGEVAGGAAVGLGVALMLADLGPALLGRRRLEEGSHE